MTSPAKFKKDKEIIAEYDTQVKGKAALSSPPLPCCSPGCGVWVGKGGNGLQIAWNPQGFLLTQRPAGSAGLFCGPHRVGATHGGVF